MRRRIALSAGLIALTAALGLTGCDDGPKSGDTGAPPAASKTKEYKGGKGHIASDDLPPAPVRQ
jgi:hypothetical protein